MGSVLLLNQRLTETTVEKCLSDRNEDSQHRDHAELRRQQKPGQNHRNDKVDSLLADPLEKTPEERTNSP